MVGKATKYSGSWQIVCSFCGETPDALFEKNTARRHRSHRCGRPIWLPTDAGQSLAAGGAPVYERHGNSFRLTDPAGQHEGTLHVLCPGTARYFDAYNERDEIEAAKVDAAATSVLSQYKLTTPVATVSETAGVDVPASNSTTVTTVPADQGIAARTTEWRMRARAGTDTWNDTGTARSVTCHKCGEVFTAKRPDARYCSGRCRVAAHRATAEV